MKKKILAYYMFLSILTLVFSTNGFSWDNEVTHKDLSKFAAENSVLDVSKGNYMKNLGYNFGLSEKFTWGNKTQSVLLWLREGAFLEDAGSNLDVVAGKARFNNHFHNPLKLWEAAGLSDMQSGESSVLWAQDSNKQSTSVGGDWSWQKTRLCYYNALTAQTDNDRQTFFACTFMGLGYQIHLIQDMSVPAHVRNDAHPEDAFLGKNYLTGDYYFETWAKKNAGYINSSASTPVFPLVSLAIAYGGYVPITQFIDTEQYYGENPSSSSGLGLSEYTNANFVSDDTIFTEDKGINHKHYFPYPRYSTNSYEMYEVEHSLITKRIYLRKKGDGEGIEHFATAGPLFKFLSFNPVLQKSELKLDPAVYKDYASLLIPRAVGYSAGLLNYFFRGDIDIVPDDATGSGYVIVNNSDEDMNGTFELWYDNTNDERVKVSGANWALALGKKSSGNNKSANITFAAPANAKEPDKYTLVFKGKFGGEQDAVVGKEISLIPLLIFLHNGQNTLFMAFDKDLRLTPYSPFTLTLGNAGLSGIETSPATIQSNKTFTEHYYMPSTTQNKKIPSSNFQKYGRLSYSSGKAYLLGNRNSFAPTGLEKTSPLQYNADLSYLSYKTSAPTPYYISSGRYDWAYKNDSIIKKLEAWQETDNKPHIRYTTRDGVVKGNALPFSEVYAVLSPDKVIGISSSTIIESSYKEGTRIALRQDNNVARDYDTYTGQPLIFGGFSTYRYGNGFYFGDVLLDASQTSYHQSGNPDGIYRSCQWLSGGAGRYYYWRDYPLIRFNSEGWNSLSYNITDYDNINNDEIFIVIYAKTGYNTKVNAIYSWPSQWYDLFRVESTDYSGNIRSFNIAYSTKAGGLQQAEVCRMGFTTTIQEKLLSDVCETYEFSYDSAASQQFQGQAMFNPSTKIFDFNGRTYIAYSYSIYDYIGDPKVANFASELSSDWRFNKRIVGIIDGDTGEKSETEINDSFLGDMYKDKFDKTLYSAIGFHNGSMKKQE